MRRSDIAGTGNPGKKKKGSCEIGSCRSRGCRLRCNSGFSRTLSLTRQTCKPAIPPVPAVQSTPAPFALCGVQDLRKRLGLVREPIQNRWRRPPMRARRLSRPGASRRRQRWRPIAFYDIDSRPIKRILTDREKSLYLREIRKDIAYFSRSFQKAHLCVDITGSGPDEAARKVRDAMTVARPMGRSEVSRPLGGSFGGIKV